MLNTCRVNEKPGHRSGLIRDKTLDNGILGSFEGGWRWERNGLFFHNNPVILRVHLVCLRIFQEIKGINFQIDQF